MLHLEGNWKKIESVRRRKHLLIGGHKSNEIYFDINYVAIDGYLEHEAFAKSE